MTESPRKRWWPISGRSMSRSSAALKTALQAARTGKRGRGRRGGGDPDGRLVGGVEPGLPRRGRALGALERAGAADAARARAATEAAGGFLGGRGVCHGGAALPGAGLEARSAERWGPTTALPELMGSLLDWSRFGQPGCEKGRAGAPWCSPRRVSVAGQRPVSKGSHTQPGARPGVAHGTPMVSAAKQRPRPTPAGSTQPPEITARKRKSSTPACGIEPGEPPGAVVARI